ncbi:MAG TPA: LysR family transcriptional regulator [Pseudonocardiaceae bacterium]
MIDPAGVQALAALSDHGTVAAAATVLGFTPSAVSQQIKRLEVTIGEPLTEQVGRVLRLTPAGHLLVREGSGLITQWADLEARLPRAGKAPSGRITLGAFPTAVRGIVIPAIRALRDRAPELTVRPSEIDVGPGIDAVRAGRLDACVVHGWRGVAAPIPVDLVTEDIGTDHADVAVREDHPLAGRERLTPAELVDLMWTIQPPGTICHRWFLYMFSALGRTPAQCWEVGEYENQLELVRELGAVALIPRLGRPAFCPGIRFVPVVDPQPLRDITVIWRRGLQGTRQHEFLTRALRQVRTQ